ncbi:hypothetical protein I79_024617 [Cricetulus griseus]|uniref:Uncharacterized protein n=1 Tax=Cricetulus griseus TaxID=10029 RepID=G3IL55_CRIGR|nr:hypothetical protein I79_024617 [Cricetulus griseus]
MWGGAALQAATERSPGLCSLCDLQGTSPHDDGFCRLRNRAQDEGLRRKSLGYAPKSGLFNGGQALQSAQVTRRLAPSIPTLLGAKRASNPSSEATNLHCEINVSQIPRDHLGAQGPRVLSMLPSGLCPST